MLTLSRFDRQHLLTTGVYYLDVVADSHAYQATLEGISAQSPRRVDYALEVKMLPIEPQGLSLGVMENAVLDTQQSPHFRTFVITLPQGIEYWRLDLLSDFVDFDVFIEEGPRMHKFLQTPYRKVSPKINLDLKMQKVSSEEKQYFITVVASHLDVGILPFQLLVSPFHQIPSALKHFRRVQYIPTYQGLDKVLSTVVQITTDTNIGSGSIISPKGHVLTNYHVVKDFNHHPHKDLVISYSLMRGKPPLELFHARILEYEPEADLALLQIVSGLYGEPLEEEYEFPYLSLACFEDISFGEPLWIIGYPFIGGHGSRTSLTLTKGVVSGFEIGNSGRYIKTDGQINQGSSGGAILNQQEQLIGIPTNIVTSKFNSHMAMGFVYPVELIPRAWLHQLQLCPS